jgi:hypothetical protein
MRPGIARQGRDIDMRREVPASTGECSMKKYLIGAALAVASLSASAQVTISIGQPGYYGRVDMGSFAPPPQVYGPPVLVSGGYNGAPVYLRAPQSHRRHWSRYCGRYNACGQRVLFVRDDWYTNSYAPRYRTHYGHGGPGWRDGGRNGYYDGRGHGRGPDHWRDRGHGGPGRWDNGHHGGPGRGNDGHHGGPGRGDGGGRGGHNGGGDHRGGDRGR